MGSGRPLSPAPCPYAGVIVGARANSIVVPCVESFDFPENEFTGFSGYLIFVIAYFFNIQSYWLKRE